MRGFSKCSTLACVCVESGGHRNGRCTSPSGQAVPTSIKRHDGSQVVGTGKHKWSDGSKSMPMPFALPPLVEALPQHHIGCILHFGTLSPGPVFSSAEHPLSIVMSLRYSNILATLWFLEQHFVQCPVHASQSSVPIVAHLVKPQFDDAGRDVTCSRPSDADRETWKG